MPAAEPQIALLIVAPDEAMQPERRCVRGSPGEQLVPSAPGPVDLTAGGSGLAAGVCLSDTGSGPALVRSCRTTPEPSGSQQTGKCSFFLSCLPCKPQKVCSSVGRQSADFNCSRNPRQFEQVRLTACVAPVTESELCCPEPAVSNQKP